MKRETFFLNLILLVMSELAQNSFQHFQNLIFFNQSLSVDVTAQSMVDMLLSYFFTMQ